MYDCYEEIKEAEEIQPLFKKRIDFIC